MLHGVKPSHVNLKDRTACETGEENKTHISVLINGRTDAGCQDGVSHLLYLGLVLLRLLIIDVLQEERQQAWLLKLSVRFQLWKGSVDAMGGVADLACHRVEAVVPAVERHPDGREDVPPPLAGVLQCVLHVVEACSVQTVRFIRSGVT